MQTQLPSGRWLLCFLRNVYQIESFLVLLRKASPDPTGMSSLPAILRSDNPFRFGLATDLSWRSRARSPKPHTAYQRWSLAQGRRAKFEQLDHDLDEPLACDPPAFYGHSRVWRHNWTTICRLILVFCGWLQHALLQRAQFCSHHARYFNLLLMSRLSAVCNRELYFTLPIHFASIKSLRLRA